MGIYMLKEEMAYFLRFRKLYLLLWGRTALHAYNVVSNTTYGYFTQDALGLCCYRLAT